MTFQEFIKQETAGNIASMAGVSRQSVYKWRDGLCAPQISQAFRLVVASQYKLTLDDIYGPFLKRKFKGKSFKSVLRGREVQLEFKF